jgi:hypothetical protein
MNVASNLQAYVSQEFSTHEVNGEFEVGEEGEILVDTPWRNMFYFADHMVQGGYGSDH